MRLQIVSVPKGTFEGKASIRAGTAEAKEFPGLPPTASNAAASAALKIEITDENGKLKSVDEMNGPIEISLDTFGVKPEDLDQYSMLIVINPDDSGKSEKLTIPSEALALNTNVTPATVSFYLKATSFVAMLIKTSEVPKSYKPKFDDADADGIADINDVCPTSTNNETSIRYKDADADGVFAASAVEVCADDEEFTIAANELSIEQKTNLDPVDVAPTGTTPAQRSKPTLSYAGATGTTGVAGVAMEVAPTSLLSNGSPITDCDIKIPTASLPAGLDIDSETCVISGTPTETASAQTYTIVATNALGTSLDATVVLNIAAGAPTLAYSGTPTFDMNTPVSIAPVALQNNGSAITACAVKAGSPNLPAGLSINSECVISGTPTAPVQSGSFIIVATNSIGNSADASTIFTIRPPAPTLSFAGATGTSGSFGSAMNIAPTTLTTNGATLANCGIKVGSTALPAGLSVNTTTCVISGTPTQTVVNGNYVLVASHYGGISADAAITLNIAAQTPILSYSASTGKTGGVGSAMSISPSTLDARGANVTACAIKGGTTALPNGLSVNATTCVISGTPTAVAANVNYTLVATNSIGDSTDAIVTLNIGAQVPVLSFAGSSGTSGSFGSAMSITPQTLDARGSGITG